MKSSRINSSFEVETSCPVKKLRVNNYPPKTARDNVLVIPDYKIV